jgi:N-acetylneuraminic acid mutarotase
MSMLSVYTVMCFRKEGDMIVKVLLMLLALFSGIYAQSNTTVEWESHSKTPNEMFAGGFVSCDDALYSIGGSSNNSQLRTTYKYELATNQWTQKASMQTKRMNAAFVSTNGKIHAIAGDSFLDVHEVYDPINDEWSLLAPIPTNIQHVKGVAVNGKIYVMGGLESWFIVSNKNQVYDIKTDSWLEMAPMPIGKHNYSSIVHDDNIYVFGGGVYDADSEGIWGSNSSIEVYHTKADTWETIGNMPTSLFYGGIVVYGDEVIILGGFRDTDTPEARVDIFSLETHTWRKGLPLPKGIVALGAVEYNDQLYVSGGADSSQTWLANRNLYQISIKTLLKNID